MSYSKTQWIDDATPLNAANMNKIENELFTLDGDISTKQDVIQLAELPASAAADYVGKIVQYTGADTTFLKFGSFYTGAYTPPNFYSWTPVPVQAVDQTYSPTSENAQSGMAVAEAIAHTPPLMDGIDLANITPGTYIWKENTQLYYTLTQLNGSQEVVQTGYYARGNTIIKIVSQPNDTYIHKVAYVLGKVVNAYATIIDVDCITLKTSYNPATGRFVGTLTTSSAATTEQLPVIDQTYSDTSPNAQSGVAVAKAVNDLKIATDTKIHFRKIKDITVQAMETQPNTIVVTADNDLKAFSLSRIVVEVVIPVGSLTGSYNISFWIPDVNGYNTQVIYLIGTPSSASNGSVTVADITNVGGKAIAQAVSNRTITNPLNMIMRNAGLPSQSVTPIWGLANTITKFQVGLGSSQLWSAGTTITIWGVDA